MPPFFGFKRGERFGVITAQSHYVFYPQVIQVNEQVFGVVFGKAAAQNMRHGVGIKFMHQGRTDTYRSRPFTGFDLNHRAVIAGLVQVFFAVIGNVYKFRLQFHKGGDVAEELIDLPPFYRRKDLNGKQGLPPVIGNMFSYSGHGQ
ncbi:hypothetical protein FQZ97_974640 [compost metagenome]